MAKSNINDSVPENIETFCEKCGKVFITSSSNSGLICPNCITGDGEKTPVTFIEALHDKIDYFRKEFNLTYAEAVGGLEIVKFDILEEMKEDD